MTILMSADNPGGAKLEEHLQELIGEIEAKCARLAGDQRPEALDVLRNNRDITARLKECLALQTHSLQRLGALGPDPGPTGTPRVGAGSKP
ncbi:hypothetical protein [Methylobacterium aquaticum]|uniref:Uncharacterized protein n=1 Tax=Methylobacterium aquaticum TaxID=270351 RepID=A0A0J6SLL4_9HYPH|nr:hypothetical protein [Methylobacterium aquaticum]KMO34313.1 hypothetical protein VP06_14700 [Methylobacterium aquaticum]